MRHPIKHIAADLLSPLGGLGAADPPGPNIVSFLYDDLGYGDVHCLDPECGRIRDTEPRPVRRGRNDFSDAQASSSVCTPTRYGMMTGSYNWRTRLQSGVLNGCSEPLIAKDRLTVPALQSKGHFPSADLRGSMADIFHGGHRVLFIARRPDRVKSCSRRAQTICLTDLMATCAGITGAKQSNHAEINLRKGIGTDATKPKFP